ncbi:MAG: chemotaxis-specific protein-glutamate methyltransferase CheB [Dehalococcoidia bacterium]|nr:chemotaxis-specific protein-glutamate methyltransferase CheB [Dehalococcoidia bacterium]
MLVVDDSAFMRRALERIIERTPGLVVAGTAGDGLEAVRQTLALRPDVITMDVEMPRLNGVRAVAEIMHAVPTPVVMVSTLTEQGTETAIQALEAGAVECVAKPGPLSTSLAEAGDEIVTAIRRASAARLRRLRPGAASAPPPPDKADRHATASESVVVIGASTGGPPALTRVLSALPASLPAGVVVVQHMPAGFTEALARRLDGVAALHVEEAREGSLVERGKAIVARGDYHAVIGSDRRVHLDSGPSLHGVRPAVDVTLQSAAAVYGAKATVAILTGMGRDGAEGASLVEDAGGRVVVQDEATSVIYGMPRVAREKTRNPVVAPLEGVAEAIARAVGGGSSR